VIKKIQGLFLIVQPFIIVRRCGSSSFLSAMVWGAEKAMLVDVVVVVVGCFAASAASLHFIFNRMIPIPP
jgi:hypothetical protein